MATNKSAEIEDGKRETKPGKMIGLILGLNVLIYLQVLGFGLIDGWDDLHYFIDRPLLDTWFDASLFDRVFTPDIGYPSAIPTFLYVLMKTLSEGGAMVAAHGVSLGFHLLNAVLVFLVLRRWLDREKTAFWGAMVWSVHPVLVESVAWISNLKSLGASTALLGLLLVWHRYQEEEKGYLLVVSAGLVLVGFGFKPSAVIAVPMLFAFAVIWSWRKVVTPRLLAFFAIMGGVTAAYLRISNELHRALIVEKAGFEMVERNLSEMLTAIGGAFFVQMKNLAYPISLHPMYFETEVSPAMVFIGWGLIAGLGALTLVLWRQQSKGLAGMLVFWVTYLPASGIEYLPRFTADTYTYLPWLGLVWAGAALFSEYRAKLGEVERVIKPVGVVVMIVFALLAAIQTTRWENSRSLWVPVLQENPEQYVPHQLVAQIYAEDEDYETAAAILKEGVKYYADAGGDRILSLSYALEKAGRPDEALKHVLRVLRGEFAMSEKAGPYAVYLLVGYELPMPGGEEDQQLLRRELEEFLKTQELSEEERGKVERYLEE